MTKYKDTIEAHGMTNLETRAKQFAKKMHKGQKRLDGKEYFTHPARVVEVLKRLGIRDEEVIAAAWLHDVVEDCNIPIVRIERQFNREIARIVYLLSNNVPRKLAKEEYMARIENADRKTQIIKLADVVCNIYDLNGDCPWHTVRNKIVECRKLYIDLARKISPEINMLLEKRIDKIELAYGLPYAYLPIKSEPIFAR